MTRVKLIFGFAVAAIVYSNLVLAANECQVQYRYTYKSVETKLLNINAGQTKDLNQVTSVQWVKNKKEWPASIYITNKGVGSQNKWVELPHMNNVDPPVGQYPNGVTLYKVRCADAGPGEVEVMQGQITTLPASPAVRSLSAAERNLARTVYGKTINFDLVKVTNTVGLESRPWTTNTPPIYTINVGVDAYPNLATAAYDALLIHELGHVWQGQHGVPFVSNSAYHQTMAAIQNNGDPGTAYRYVAGQQWSKYNVEQQASIITRWFTTGRKTDSELFPYIRDNVQTGQPNARTVFKKK